MILYNPTNPRQAVVYGAIPGRVQITNQGHVFSPQRWHSIQCLIAPILSIALIGVIVSIMIKGLP